MFGYLNHSLLLRAGLAMGIITLLAVAGMTSAVYVARSTAGEASAINLAGSLRMQSYRIAAALEAGRNIGPDLVEQLDKLTDEFEQQLISPGLAEVAASTKRKSLHVAYRDIEVRWHAEVLPVIRQYTEKITSSPPDATLNQARLSFRKLIAGYVSDIHHMVRLLEEDAESRIHMLGLMQGISLMLTLFVAVITLYLLHTDVLSPLRDLLNSAERAGRGDFSVRVGLTGADELGRLGQAFNTMTEDLSKMYGKLEQRVTEKTAELTLRNRSLELLYDAAQRLTQAPVSEETYDEMLAEISRVVGTQGITLCLMNEEKDRAYQLARNGPAPPMCLQERCDICLGDDRVHLLTEADHGATPDILAVPVRDQENDYGVLLVEPQSGTPLEPWQIQLLGTIGKHIGISMGVTRQVAQRRRLALLDERSAIARELHDTLAQSLSYLQIQVTRLYILMRSDAEQQAVNEVLGELKEGLGAAYHQLRELLTTFRLQMNERGLGAALEETVAEFNERGEVEIQLDDQIIGDAISVNEEIHVLQIVREALSNVMYHSGATLALVRLSTQSDNSLVISVVDNGVGIPAEARRTHHYGLTIMRERANSLDGDLRIEPNPEGGTRVTLSIPPNNGQTNKLNHQEAAAT